MRQPFFSKGDGVSARSDGPYLLYITMEWCQEGRDNGGALMRVQFTVALMYLTRRPTRQFKGRHVNHAPRYFFQTPACSTICIRAGSLSENARTLRTLHPSIVWEGHQHVMGYGGDRCVVSRIESIVRIRMVTQTWAGADADCFWPCPMKAYTLQK